MPNEGRIKIIFRRTSESAVMVPNVKRAMATTAKLNPLIFNDVEEFLAIFSELSGKKADDIFSRSVILFCWRGPSPRRA